MPPSLATVQRIFTAACELHGEARADHVRRACGDDAELHAAVLALLRSDEQASLFADDKLAAVRGTLRDDAVPLPARIADFEVLDVLGRGGMGIVYRGRQQHPAREVAIKVLAPHAGGAQARARFQLEAEALGRLQHRGIAQILAAGTWSSPVGEQPFLAMELVRGQPLLAWAEAARPELSTRLRVLLELCDAVHHAHQRGLIHRDLKPGNVFVDEQGHVKVLDFGIARLVDDDRSATLQTHTGEVLGTLAYMSPEQANGLHDRIDVRADVYAAGVLGYQLLAGVLPIAVDAPSLTANLRRVAEADPVPLGRHDRSFAGDLETIFAKALRKEPEHRYASMQAFGDDLQRFLAHEPIAARPTTFGYVASRFARRHRGLVAGAAVAVLAIVGGSVAAVTWALRADAEAVRANAAVRTASAAEREARREAATAEDVSRFLTTIFEKAAPEIAAGRTFTARDLVQLGIDSLGAELGKEPAVRGRLSRVLGQVAVAYGDVAAALPLLTAAVEWARGALPEGDARRRQAEFEFGRVQYERGDVAAAERLFEQCLAAARDGTPEAVAFAAECHEALGSCAHARGDEPAALRHYEALHAVWQHADAVRHARSLAHLARTHGLLGDDDRAEDAYDEALRLLRGAEATLAHAEVALGVGVYRGARGRYGEAEEVFREALAVQVKVCGERHPILLETRFNLANALVAQQRVDEARQILDAAVALGDQLGLQKNSSFANVLCLSGTVRLMQGAAGDAVPFYERGIAMLEQLHGRDASVLRVPLNNFGRALQTLGDTARVGEIRARLDALRRD